MKYKTIPKGYFKVENPLPHSFNYRFGLNIDDSVALNCTYLPILLNDEGLVNPDTVNVNPEHGSFAESTNPYCYKNSIIPRLNIHMSAQMSKGAIETDKLRHINFSILPIYTAFLSRLDAADSKTAVDVEAILELEHETVGKSCYPLWSGTNLTLANTVGIHANATTALMGLTTDAILESIVYDKELFFDAMQYYTNGSMLRKVVGRRRSVYLNRDFTWRFNSNNFTMPMVKRINEYTFCGILIHAGKAGDADQLIEAGSASSINHIDFNAHVRYDEWNAEFDQTAS